MLTALALLAATDVPVILTAAGGLVVALSGVGATISARRSSKVATDVAVIDAVQRTQMETIDYLRREVNQLRDELRTMEGRHDTCEAERRALTVERQTLIAEIAVLKGQQR